MPNQQPSTPVWGSRSSSPIRSNSSGTAPMRSNSSGIAPTRSSSPGMAPTRSNSPGTAPIPNHQPSPPTGSSQRPISVRNDSSSSSATASYQPRISIQRAITIRGDSSDTAPEPNRQPSPPSRQSTTIRSNSSDNFPSNPEPRHERILPIDARYGRAVPIEEVLGGVDSITDWTQWDRDQYVKKVQECLRTDPSQVSREVLFNRISQDFAYTMKAVACRSKKLELMRKLYTPLSEDEEQRFQRCEKDMTEAKGVLEMDPSDPRFRTLQLKVPDWKW